MVLEKKWGYGCRKKSETFNVKEHVKMWRETGPENGEFYTEKEFFEEIVPKLAQDFEDYAAKPGWVIIPSVQIANFKGCGDSYSSPVSVRVLRCHHSYMDGLSAGLLVTECLMDFESCSVPFVLDPKVNLQVKVRRHILFENFLGFLQLPFHLMRKVFDGKANTGVEFDPTLGRTSDLRHFGVTKNLAFARVRDLRSNLESTENHRNNTTTNVLGSIVVSALGQVRMVIILISNYRYSDIQRG